MFRFLLILFYFLLGGNDDLQKGIDLFNARAQNAIGLQAEETTINKAIQIFELLLKENKNNETAASYYLRSLNFKGRFVFISNLEKKKIFTKAIEKGNEFVKQFPNNGSIRFELISSIGLLAEQDAIVKSIENGVLQQMLFHAQMLINCDSMYNQGGGWKVLAILNYKTPHIPLLLSWPSKETAKLLLKKALSYFPINIPNNFYYAEALLENKEISASKIYFQLVLKLPSRKDCILEDEYFKTKARNYLLKL